MFLDLRLKIVLVQIAVVTMPLFFYRLFGLFAPGENRMQRYFCTVCTFCHIYIKWEFVTTELRYLVTNRLWLCKKLDISSEKVQKWQNILTNKKNRFSRTRKWWEDCLCQIGMFFYLSFSYADTSVIPQVFPLGRFYYSNLGNYYHSEALFEMQF